MTLQSASPWSLFAPKPGWSEITGPGKFRLMILFEECAILESRETPLKGAFIEALNGRN